MMRKIAVSPFARLLSSALCFLVLTACGGGSGGDTGGAAPASTQTAGSAATQPTSTQGTSANAQAPSGGNPTAVQGATASAAPGIDPGSTASPVTIAPGNTTEIINVININIDPLANAGTINTAPVAPTPPAPGQQPPPLDPNAPIETPVAQARFNYPQAVTINGQGTMHVADSGNHTIRRITRTGTVTTIAGMSGQSGTADGVGSAARFSQLRAITVDNLDNVYVIDGNAIRRIAPDRTVTTISGSVASAGLIDGPRLGARYSDPQGIMVDGEGDIYIADTGNDAIRKIAPGGTVTTLTTAIKQPRSLVAQNSVLFIADNFAVWRMPYGGQPPQRIAGDSTSGYKMVDGPGYTARFWPITGMTITPSGHLYVLEGFTFIKSTSTHSTIRKIVPVDRGLTWMVSTFVGGEGPQAVDGTGLNARLNLPLDITCDISGNLFIADTASHTIRMVTADAVVTTYAGHIGERGSNY
jgi:hypothetical protein